MRCVDVSLLAAIFKSDFGCIVVLVNKQPFVNRIPICLSCTTHKKK